MKSNPHDYQKYAIEYIKNNPLDRAIRCGNVSTESVYDTRGILFV